MRWEINAIHATGCTDEVIIPRLGISSGKLKPGKTLWNLLPPKVAFFRSRVGWECKEENLLWKNRNT